MRECCDLSGMKYIAENKELSEEGLDKIFGKGNYQALTQKMPYSKKETMDFIFGEGKYIFVDGGIKTLQGNAIHLIKDIDREFDYIYKVIVDNVEYELCGCDCHVIGLNVIH
jgi:hypothetical protein